MYVWPITLPQNVQKGFTETIGVLLLRTPMDSGPAKYRRRGRRPSTMNVSFIMTESQIPILETFVLNTIKGTSKFEFPHPRLHTPIDVRLVPEGDGSLYTIVYRAPGYYDINLKLEILP